MDAQVSITVEKEPEVIIQRQVIVVEVEKRHYPKRPHLTGDQMPFVAPSAMWPQCWG